jgi:hypothetical protein
MKETKSLFPNIHLIHTDRLLSQLHTTDKLIDRNIIKMDPYTNVTIEKKWAKIIDESLEKFCPDYTRSPETTGNVETRPRLLGTHTIDPVGITDRTVHNAFNIINTVYLPMLEVSEASVRIIFENKLELSGDNVQRLQLLAMSVDSSYIKYIISYIIQCLNTNPVQPHLA